MVLFFRGRLSAFTPQVSQRTDTSIYLILLYNWLKVVYSREILKANATLSLSPAYLLKNLVSTLTYKILESFSHNKLSLFFTEIIKIP